MQGITENTNHKTFIQERTQLSNLGFSTDNFREKPFLRLAWKLKRWRDENRKRSGRFINECRGRGREHY